MRIISILLLSVLPLISFSQSKREIEKKRKELEKSIAESKQILNETRKKKAVSMNALSTIKSIIEKEENLIVNFETEIKTLDSDIQSQMIEFSELNGGLIKERKRYAELILKAYKAYNSQSKILYLFSSKNFNQAFKRLRYIIKASSYEKKLITNIDEKKNRVKYSMINLNVLKHEKLFVLTDKERKKQELEEDKVEKEIIFGELKNQEKQLYAVIRDNEKSMKRLDNTLKELIAKEIREAQRKEADRIASIQRKNKERKVASTTNKSNSNSKSNSGSKQNTNRSPEIASLDVVSNSFKSNRLRLPNPVDNGFVTTKFGMQPHPSIDNITINNNGVDFSVKKGSYASCVYDGVVSAVLDIPGMGKTVLVSHGIYFTVYSKMSDVFVNQGDKISTKQRIGRVYTDDNEKTEFHFEVWYNQEKQNPEWWLSGRY